MVKVYGLYGVLNRDREHKIILPIKFKDIDNNSRSFGSDEDLFICTQQDGRYAVYKTNGDVHFEDLAFGKVPVNIDPKRKLGAILETTTLKLLHINGA